METFNQDAETIMNKRDVAKLRKDLAVLTARFSESFNPGNRKFFYSYLGTLSGPMAPE